jgi:hypothetical protein
VKRVFRISGAADAMLTDQQIVRELKYLMDRAVLELTRETAIGDGIDPRAFKDIPMNEKIKRMAKIMRTMTVTVEA